MPRIFIRFSREMEDFKYFCDGMFADNSNMTYDNGREREVVKVTLVGSVVNGVLIVLKFLAGWLGHSSAMMADAVHSLSDFVTDAVVVVFVKIAGRPSDRDHKYGHGKFETLATMLIGVILIGVGAGICIAGCRSVWDALHGVLPHRPGWVALIVAVISIVCKEVLYRYTMMRGRRLDAAVVIANAWHHRSDAFSSIGTLAGIAGAMFLGEPWRVLDPIAAIAVSYFIVKVGVQVVRPCLDELLERSLPETVEREIVDLIEGVKGVSRPHNVRTRRIGNNIAIEAHVRMDGDLTLREAHHLASEVESVLRERYGHATHIGLHMEPLEATHVHEEDLK